MRQYIPVILLFFLLLPKVILAQSCNSCQTCGVGCHQTKPNEILCCMPKEEEDTSGGGNCPSGCTEDFPGHCSCSTGGGSNDPSGFVEGWSTCNNIMGWATDGDETNPQTEIPVEIYLDSKQGSPIATGVAGAWRQDIGSFTGFNIDVAGKVPSGVHYIYAKGKNIGGGRDKWLGCWSSNANPQTPSHCVGGVIQVDCTPPTPTPTTVCTVPSSVSNAQSSCSAPNQITLSWNPVAGATSYALRINNPNDISTLDSGSCPAASGGPGDHCKVVTGTTYSFTAAPGVNYNWWIHAVNACGGYSSAVGGPSRQCLPPTPTCSLPSVPSNLQVTCLSANQARLSWNAMAGASNYELRIDNSPPSWNGSCSPGAPSDSCATVASNAYTVNVNPNTTYSWWLHSVSTCGAMTLPASSGPQFNCGLNCSINSVSSTNVMVNTPVTISSQFQSSAGSLLGQLYKGNFNNISIQPLSGTNDTINATWTPTDADIGTQNICCRAINDPNLQCTSSLPPYPGGSPPRVSCPGPNVCRQITVVGYNEWFKLKNTSYHRTNALDVVIPPLVVAYDNDDTGEAYPIIGQVGVVTNSASSVTVASASHQISSRQWLTSGFTEENVYLDNIQSYATYALQHNIGKKIQNINEMESGKVNVYQGNLVLNSLYQVSSSVENAVLVVQGDLTIAPSNNAPTEQFNTSVRSLAFLATGGIYIHSKYTELNGIFIAQNDINISYDTVKSSNPLKVNGNLISNRPISDLRRKQSDYNKPSLFIVFRPKMYIDLIPYLSILQLDVKKLQ